MKANITISPDEIGRIIAEHYKALGLPIVSPITFNLEGWGPSMFTSASFDVEMPAAAPKQKKRGAR